MALKAVIGIPFGTRMGGAEGILWSLLRHRAAADLEPHVVFFRDGPFNADVRALGITTSVIDPGRFRQPWRLAAAIRQTAQLLRSARPDLVISFYWRVQTVFAPAAALTGNARRVVMWEHEVPEPTPTHRVSVMLPCAWVVGDSRAGSDANRRIWPHRDGTYVWPGIDPPASPAAAEVDALRRRLALPADRPVVGIVGRLLSWKGQDRLIEAAALLRDRGVDATYLIVGAETHGVEAGIEARLRDLVRRLRLEDRVIFTGHVDRPWTYMALMDVFVSASDGEPFGIVLLEAMALGVPVVAVDRYGPSEILAGETGFLVPSPAPDDLAGGIAAALADPAATARRTQRARDRMQRHFTAERMARDIGRTLAGVAAEARRS